MRPIYSFGTFKRARRAILSGQCRAEGRTLIYGSCSFPPIFPRELEDKQQYAIIGYHTISDDFFSCDANQPFLLFTFDTNQLRSSLSVHVTHSTQGICWFQRNIVSVLHTYFLSSEDGTVQRSSFFYWYSSCIKVLVLVHQPNLDITYILAIPSSSSLLVFLPRWRWRQRSNELRRWCC